MQRKKTDESIESPSDVTYWNQTLSKNIYTSPWCTLRLDTVVLPNGITINDYSVVDLPSVVVVLAQTDEGKILLVRQYRYAVNQMFLELPAGAYDPKIESAKDAAIRELWEETGYKADDLIQLGKLYEYPTKLTYSVTLFLAKKVTYLPTQSIDDTEEISVLEIPFEEALSMVENGEICVAGSVTAILLAQKYLSQNN